MPVTITAARYNKAPNELGDSQLRIGMNYFLLHGTFPGGPAGYTVSFHGPPNGTINPVSISIDMSLSCTEWLIGQFMLDSRSAKPSGYMIGVKPAKAGPGDFTVTVTDSGGVTATFDCVDTGDIAP